MMGNWYPNRPTVISVAVKAVLDWGYAADTIADHMAQSNYRGQNEAIAAGHIRREINQAIGAEQYQRWIAERRKYRLMAEELIAEGWRWVNDTNPNYAGLWVHDASGASVNVLGGTFRSYEQATLKTHESHTRQWVKKHYAALVGTAS